VYCVWWFAGVISAEEVYSEKSAVDLDSDAATLPFQTVHENRLDSSSECRTSLLTAEHEEFLRQTRVTSPVPGGRKKDPGIGSDVADGVLGGTETDLDKGEEETISTHDAKFDRHRNGDEHFRTVPGGDAQKDQGRGVEERVILCDREQNAIECKNIDAASIDGADKDFVAEKELSSVVTGVNSNRGRNEDTRTVFADAERVIRCSEDVGLILADVDADAVIKDENDNELKSGNQFGRTAPTDCAFLEQPEESRVRSVCPLPLYCRVQFNTTAKFYLFL